jgi:protein FAM50
MEESLKKSTIGLVRLEDFQNKRKELEEAKAREAARTNELKYIHPLIPKYWPGGWLEVEGLIGMRRLNRRSGRRLPNQSYRLQWMTKKAKANKKRRRKRKKKTRKVKVCLSPASLFHRLTPLAEPPVKRNKINKNPAVDTSFLPDREREENERRAREELRQEWLRKQEELKAEEIEVTYSYWDGSGHRKSVMVC